MVRERQLTVDLRWDMHKDTEEALLCNDVFLCHLSAC